MTCQPMRLSSNIYVVSVTTGAVITATHAISPREGKDQAEGSESGSTIAVPGHSHARGYWVAKRVRDYFRPRASK